MGTWYLLGAVAGALLFGYLTDRLGRKKLFRVTLAVYLVFTVASGLAWNYWSFAMFRILAGTHCGGNWQNPKPLHRMLFQSGFCQQRPKCERGGRDLGDVPPQKRAAPAGSLLTGLLWGDDARPGVVSLPRCGTPRSIVGSGASLA